MKYFALVFSILLVACGAKPASTPAIDPVVLVEQLGGTVERDARGDVVTVSFDEPT